MKKTNETYQFKNFSDYFIIKTCTDHRQKFQVIMQHHHHLQSCYQKPFKTCSSDRNNKNTIFSSDRYYKTFCIKYALL